MKIGILTSSRADYGIYLPLLNKLKRDSRFELEIVAFGMHLQDSQGFTIRSIEADEYAVIHKVGKMPDGDQIFDIAFGYGSLVKDFACFWRDNQFDLVFALGDRWEMSAAVQAALPFELSIAHIHGGETTLGAIDNIYRHQITLASSYHFTAAECFSMRISEIIGTDEGVHTVGSISLEELKNIYLPKWEDVKKEFNIPFDEFTLVTFHPESVRANRNELLCKEAVNSLEQLAKTHNLLVTKANSDALGSMYNDSFQSLVAKYPNKVKLVSALGKLNYFKAMKQCDFLLGNTSSGILEAASFSKWVINVGDRQKGRLQNANVINVPFQQSSILNAVKEVKLKSSYQGENLYMRDNTTDDIIKIILNNAKL